MAYVPLWSDLEKKKNELQRDRLGKLRAVHRVSGMPLRKGSLRVDYAVAQAWLETPNPHALLQLCPYKRQGNVEIALELFVNDLRDFMETNIKQNVREKKKTSAQRLDCLDF